VSGTKSTRFFWQDWESDESLKLCSLAAQGLWMRMLCVCAKGEGYLQVNGKPLRDEALAMVVGRPLEEIKPLLEELADAGVFSFDRRNRIYSRRMIRDGKIAIKGKQNADLRWSRHRSQATEFHNENHKPNGGPNGEANEEPNGEASSRSGDPSSDSDSFTDSSRSIDELVERLAKAAGGNVVRGSVGIEMLKPILDLQAQGCDLDADIIPAIAELAPKLGKPLRTWGAGFLRDAVLAKKAARLRNGSGEHRYDSKPAEPSETLWRRQWDWWKRTGEWPNVWGPPPTASYGCEIPKELIERWSAEAP
jgi:hypothetical protein